VSGKWYVTEDIRIRVFAGAVQPWARTFVNIVAGPNHEGVRIFPLKLSNHVTPFPFFTFIWQSGGRKIRESTFNPFRRLSGGRVLFSIVSASNHFHIELWRSTCFGDPGNSTQKYPKNMFFWFKNSFRKKFGFEDLLHVKEKGFCWSCLVLKISSF
jgi:hypothetical protein